jgi:hypothetical protein
MREWVETIYFLALLSFAAFAVMMALDVVLGVGG